VSDLLKISKILALKRSECELKLATLTARLHVLEDDIQKNCQRLTESDLNLRSQTGRDLVNQTILLEQWKGLINKQIFDKRAQLADLRVEADVYKNNLKNIIVREGLINSRLESRKLSEREAAFGISDENRLQNWVLFR
jgi:hypothetical protein